MKTKNGNCPRKQSSHSMLIDCMIGHLAIHGWECVYFNRFIGRSGFKHCDGSFISFANVRELIRFERECANRKRY